MSHTPAQRAALAGKLVTTAFIATIAGCIDALYLISYQHRADPAILAIPCLLTGAAIVLTITTWRE